MKYEITSEFIKDLHNITCTPDLKKALEKHFPKEFEEPFPQFERGLIFLTKEYEAYMSSQTNNEMFLINLDGKTWWSNYGSKNMMDSLRPMRSGTITITVKDGKVGRAVVKEEA
jgi:hypothetical protein